MPSECILMRSSTLWFATFPLLLCLPSCGLNPRTRQPVSPLVYYQKVQQARAIKAESRAHSIADAILLAYSNDYNDTLPPHNNWEASIKPYISPQLVGYLDDYSYSKSVAGKKLSQIQEPSVTELLKAKVSGPDGRVVVVYVDGHIERK